MKDHILGTDILSYFLKDHEAVNRNIQDHLKRSSIKKLNFAENYEQ